ncbi:MAG TPA: HAMP domain-containing sensor histidine kinase [Thermoanaerobaculia bacterium]
MRPWDWYGREWHSRSRRYRYPYGRYGPPRFVRQMGCAFAAMLVFAAIGTGALQSLFIHAPQFVWVIVALAIFVFFLLIAGFSFSIRRMSHVFREQDRLRRQLMADVAHELRTPLAILQGRVEGLIDGVYPRDDQHLAELLEETQHLARLVEDLRTIANAEAGALELRKEMVEPAELIRDAAAAFGPGIKVNVPADLPPIDVDPLRIREVLLNLLSNAVRHTPAGGTVSISATMQSKGLVIKVSDNGSGIPPEELPRIFERFQKGRDSRGSGLGLAIARNLVIAHGGEIHAESIVGRGTTVTVSLPA